MSYTAQLNTIGSPNGTVTFSAPLRCEGTRRRSLRLVKTSFSSQIANVYNYGNTNNGLIRASHDGGVTWTGIQLPNGVYIIKYIESGINTALADWWADPTQPGFKLRYNTASQYVYIEIDSSKLAQDKAGQLGIDFSASSVWDLLGFDASACTFTEDGIFGAVNYAKLNWFGDSVSLIVKGFGTLSLRNGINSFEIASIPLSASQVGNEYIFPSGLYTPVIPIPGSPDVIQSFSVEFLGSRVSANGSQIPILILEGNVEVVLEFSWV